MRKIIAVVLVLPAFAVIGAANAQAVATPEFVMANNDLDKDGVITKEEAMKAGRQLAQMWDAFDRNKDGKVDAEELKAVLASFQGGPPGGAPPAAR